MTVPAVTAAAVIGSLLGLGLWLRHRARAVADHFDQHPEDYGS
jgi:hypothetical protein